MTKIDIAQAQIKTVSVEIRTLSVNNKQLTLSTFRQIQEEEIINYETMTLNGVPWGRVNYFWKDNGNENTHINIIWQKGNELKRITIRQNILHHEYIDQLKYKIHKQEAHRDEYAQEYTYNPPEAWLEWNIPYLNKVINRITQLIQKLKNKELTITDDFYRFNNYQNHCDLPQINEDLFLKIKDDPITYMQDHLEIKNMLLQRAINAYEVVEKNKLDELIALKAKKESELTTLMHALMQLPHLFIAI